MLNRRWSRAKRRIAGGRSRWQASFPESLIIALLLAAPIFGADEPSTTAPVPKQNPELLQWDIDGYLSQEFRLRSVDGDTDLDSYTHLFMDAAHRGEKRVWRTRVNGRLVADLAGDQAENDPLRDVWDGFSHDVQVRIYEAYIETDGLFDMLGVRGGRQFLDEGVYLHFDGVRLDLDLASQVKNVDLSVLFGVPVRFGEPNRYENWIAGLVVRARINDRTRARFTYYHVSEFFEGQNALVEDPLQQPVSIPAQHLDDDLFGVSVWHRVKDNVRVFGRFNLLNGEANELNLRVRWFRMDNRWAVVGEWYQMFERLLNVTNDLSPFVPMLGSLEPFYRISVRVTHRHGELWMFQGGLSYRALADSDDEGTFNHEYFHYYVSVTRSDLLEDGKLDLTLTANGYASDQNDVVTVAGSAHYRLSKTIELSGGVDYALYKYDFFLDSEHENVWTYSVRVRWQAKDKVDVTGEVSVDDDRFETWLTFLLKVTVRF